MNDQQGFIVGVGCGWAPVERSRDHCFVVDHGELVIDILGIDLLMGGFRAADVE